jgi:hypothetical protein
MEKEIQEETRKAEESSRRQRARQESSDEEAATPREERAAERTPPAPKVRVVKMTPAQKRDLARLIKLYLAEHPDQEGKAIGQVENEVSGR